ncbi:unnamed protein product [Rangifer tarandus platyrhynchus]|uniref:Uncharacterized protein n=1 Tax=Rangifer tarandus platyrhynchus TaxID=3082113 RepID=A0ABN9A0N3_RANTA|nr:unnamed protein product [Rangifer tarandus platyrhynchus]
MRARRCVCGGGIIKDWSDQLHSLPSAYPRTWSELCLIVTPLLLAYALKSCLHGTQGGGKSSYGNTDEKRAELKYFPQTESLLMTPGLPHPWPVSLLVDQVNSYTLQEFLSVANC